MIKNILLFNTRELPDSCAGATRTVALAKTLKECGHNVELLGVTYRKEAILEGKHEGIEYTNIKCLHSIGAIKEKRYFKERIRKILQKKEGSIDAIILYGVYDDTISPFLSFSKKTGATLIIDVVEWYNYKVKLFNPRYNLRTIRNRYTLMVKNVEAGNIIAISSLLGDYYKNRGCNTCVIPTIIDMNNYKDVKHAQQSKLQIAYAGFPGNKDYIANIVKAISLLSEDEKTKIEMHLYGTNILGALKEQGLDNKELEKVEGHVFFHNSITQKKVKEKVAAADFTILLRPNMRYANAGFPTKVGESMACGTPVIANITSDLDKYIIDGKTGIVCEDESVESCLKAIRKAMSLTLEEKDEMRIHTLEMAKKSFDYRNHVEKIKEFLENIKE